MSWLPRLATRLRTLWVAKTYPFAALGGGGWAHYSAHIEKSEARYISIGKDVVLARDARLEILPPHDTDLPVVILGDSCGVQRRCVISARHRIHIMRNVIFGPSVMVRDYGDAAAGGKILIEEECWIGFGTRIVCENGELVIGRHCVIGANSFINRSIPPFSVVAGDPARIVKQYDFSKKKWVLGCVSSSTSVK